MVLTVTNHDTTTTTTATTTTTTTTTTANNNNDSTCGVFFADAVCANEARQDIWESLGLVSGAQHNARSLAMSSYVRQDMHI